MKIGVENNLTERSEIELKEDSKEHSLQEEKNKDIQNSIKKDSKGDSQNDLKEEDKKDTKNEKGEEKKVDLKKSENSKEGKYEEIKEDSKEENPKMNISGNDGDNTDSFKNNINISQINNKRKSKESENYLNLYDNDLPISNNNITISKDNISFSENNKIENISNNYEKNYLLRIALTEKEENIHKEKIQQFQFKFNIHKEKIKQLQFKFIKRKLGVDDCENISGTAYEQFARKSFKIMLMIITQDNLIFENPKNFSINRFLVDYLNNSVNDSLRIKTNIHDIIKKGLIEDIIEIDTVTEFEYKVIENLISNFPKNVFFSEYIYNSENDINLDEDITLITEIAKNIVYQGSEKLSQITKYIAFISILNLYKDNIQKIIESEPFSNVCKVSKISKYTRKMFCIITDGDYFILKYAFNEIIQNLFNRKFKDYNEIKLFIAEKIKANRDIAKKTEEKEMNCIEENIINVYLMFENLKKNNIKFFILYIGDIDQCIYQQNLFYNFILNNELKEKINYDKFVESLQIKKSLPEIKEINRKLKGIINSFCNEMDIITNEKLNNLKLEPKINEVIKNLDFVNFKKIESELKFNVIFILLKKDNNDNDSIIKTKLVNTLNNNEFKAIEKYEIKTLKVLDFICNYQQTVNSLINPKLLMIYVMEIDFNHHDDETIYKIIYNVKRDNYLSDNVRYLIYTKDMNNNIQFNTEKSNYKNILDKKIVNIDDKISNILNNFKKMLSM